MECRIRTLEEDPSLGLRWALLGLGLGCLGCLAGARGAGVMVVVTFWLAYGSWLAFRFNLRARPVNS